MIELRYEKPCHTAVLAICDTCGQEITDATEGLATWRHTTTNPTYRYRLCHKGPCDDHQYEMSMILDVFLSHLLHNTGTTYEKLAVATRHAHLLS